MGPIEWECPSCKAARGQPCTEPAKHAPKKYSVTLPYHHAARVDLAFEKLGLIF